MEELLGERYSCRAFKPDPVPRADHRAHPDGGATHRVMVQQPALAARDRLRRGQGKFRELSMPRPLPARRTTAISRFRANIAASIWNAAAKAASSFTTRSASRAATRRPMRKQALENFNFFGAPHVAIIHTDEALGVYGAIDCGAYVGNFMLAAQALGLGTIPQAALARHSGLIRRHFGLGDDRRVVCGISFGFADRDTRSTATGPRAPARGHRRFCRDIGCKARPLMRPGLYRAARDQLDRRRR